MFEKKIMDALFRISVPLVLILGAAFFVGILIGGAWLMVSAAALIGLPEWVGIVAFVLIVAIVGGSLE